MNPHVAYSQFYPSFVILTIANSFHTVYNGNIEKTPRLFFKKRGLSHTNASLDYNKNSRSCQAFRCDGRVFCLVFYFIGNGPSDARLFRSGPEGRIPAAGRPGRHSRPRGALPISCIRLSVWHSPPIGAKAQSNTAEGCRSLPRPPRFPAGRRFFGSSVRSPRCPCRR